MGGTFWLNKVYFSGQFFSVDIFTEKKIEIGCHFSRAFPFACWSLSKLLARLLPGISSMIVLMGSMLFSMAKYILMIYSYRKLKFKPRN